MVTTPRMVAERAVANSRPAWLVDVVDIQTLHWHRYGLADARWRQEQTAGQKVVIYINDIIAHKLLGMGVREQPDIGKFMVETLDGTKNECGWSKAKLGANTPLAISMTACRTDAAVKLVDKRTDKFMMPVFSLNVISDESRAINCLAFLEFISVRTGASRTGKGNDHCH